ncbi:hypothetical protein CSKR_104684 [Clonorchis sinensis]|uniref:Uncharacterized protein n=1 Tax=Clonorchis sinensis TaxID=79923 RepID=A0A3R7FPB0_CLOSI|nr:hypothetical protein CSKR_104684 [Clonorchis sinensis]
MAQCLRRELIDRNVRGLNKTYLSQLLSRLGQPSSISAFVLPWGGVAAGKMQKYMSLLLQTQLFQMFNRKTRLRENAHCWSTYAAPKCIDGELNIEKLKFLISELTGRLQHN